MASTDEVVRTLDLPVWGRKNRFNVFIPDDFKRRCSFKNAVFDAVQAGWDEDIICLCEQLKVEPISEKNLYLHCR